MEDELNFYFKWKTTSTFFVNGRRPTKFCKWKTNWFFLQMEDNLKIYCKLKTTLKFIVKGRLMRRVASLTNLAGPELGTAQPKLVSSSVPDPAQLDWVSFVISSLLPAPDLNSLLLSQFAFNSRQVRMLGLEDLEWKTTSRFYLNILVNWRRPQIYL